MRRFLSRDLVSTRPGLESGGGLRMSLRDASLSPYTKLKSKDANGGQTQVRNALTPPNYTLGEKVL